MLRSCRLMPGTARRGFLLSCQHGRDLAINGGGKPRHCSDRHVARAGFYGAPKPLTEPVATCHLALRQADLLPTASDRIAENHPQLSRDVTVQLHPCHCSSMKPFTVSDFVNGFRLGVKSEF